MDTARYIFAVLVVTFLPPAVAWWFIVHPFIEFWRRRGPLVTMSVMGILLTAGVLGLMAIRRVLVGPDLGYHPALLVLAGVLMSGAAWIAVLRRRHLTFRILAGIPEIEAEHGPDALLDKGIYARMRHPRYVEVVLGTWAYAVFSNYLGAYIVAALTVPLIHLVVLVEERELIARFGDRYEAYRSRVPRYMPRRG